MSVGGGFCGARRQGCGRDCPRGSRDAAAVSSVYGRSRPKTNVIATAGLLFAGAGASNRLLLFTAAASTIAGGLSVGGASWAEEAAERDAQLLHAKQERDDLAADPQGELENSRHWQEWGLTAETAKEVARHRLRRAGDVEPWAILAAAVFTLALSSRWQHALGS